MADSAEALLRDAMTAITPAGVVCGCRFIRPDDAGLLLPAEAASLTARMPKALAASGAGRGVASALMSRAGLAPEPVLKAPSGEPLWPRGLTGSIAHDDVVAVAALGIDRKVAALGIDVEPAEPLDEEIAALAVHAGDRVSGADPNLAQRLVFAAKEAVYKAVFPLDRYILDYADIAIDLIAGTGVTTKGRRLDLAWCLVPRIVVIATMKP